MLAKFWRKEGPCTVLGGCKLVQPCVENSVEVLNKNKYQYDTVISPVNIQPREMKPQAKETSTLSCSRQRQSQLTCPSTKNRENVAHTHSEFYFILLQLKNLDDLKACAQVRLIFSLLCPAATLILSWTLSLTNNHCDTVMGWIMGLSPPLKVHFLKC